MCTEQIKISQIQISWDFATNISEIWVSENDNKYELDIEYYDFR